jgi:molybdopterin converting factor small subunit
MRVQVKLFGEFRKHMPANSSSAAFGVDVDDGTSVQALLDTLGIPSDAPKTLVHNHRAGRLDAILLDADTLAVFPPVAGGG